MRVSVTQGALIICTKKLCFFERNVKWNGSTRWKFSGTQGIHSGVFLFYHSYRNDRNQPYHLQKLTRAIHPATGRRQPTWRLAVVAVAVSTITANLQEGSSFVSWNSIHSPFRHFFSLLRSRFLCRHIASRRYWNCDVTCQPCSLPHLPRFRKYLAYLARRRKFSLDPVRARLYSSTDNGAVSSSWELERIIVYFLLPFLWEVPIS